MDFNQIPMPFRAPASDDPFRIFSSLPRVGNVPNDLWHGQAQALEQWKVLRDQSDILLSLNTGAGKTLVGLLIAQSLVNEGVDNVVYACPTNDLVIQTAKQAMNFGMSVTTRMEGRYSNSEFELGNSFCITSYSSIFNGMSSIIKNHFPGAVIFDDAHVAEAAIRDSFTLEIRADRDGDLYSKVAGLFLGYFQRSNRENRYRDAINNAPGAKKLVLVPPDAVYENREMVEALFRAHLDTSKLDHKFPYEHLKDHLGLCSFVFRSGVLQVAPPFLPSLALDIFRRKVRRIYLSATLKNKADVVRAFGRKPDHIIEPNNDAGNGERLILFERFLSNNLKIEPSFIQGISSKIKTLIAVPSYFAASRWASVASPPPKDEFSSKLDAFRSADSGCFLLVSRVDGIDLPNDTCRLMVIDGIPVGSSLVERYQHEVLSIDNFISSRMANRIVQLFGRINRGRSDYGVFIITGNDINMWLGRRKNVARLPKLLQSQILLGQTVQNSMNIRSLASFSELTAKVLLSVPRDQGWLNFYTQFLEADQIEVNITTAAEKAEQRNLLAAQAEAEAAKNIWMGNYDQARLALDEIVTEVSRSDSRYAGWLNLWIGGCLFASGETQDASVYFNRAKSQTGDGLIILDRGQAGAIEGEDGLTEPQRRILALVSGSRDSFNRRISKFNTDLLCLDGGSPNQVEEAVRALGEALGFTSTRPDNDRDVGPDVLWIDDSCQQGFGVELKTDKERDSLLNKDEIGQSLNNHLWMDREMAGHQNLGLVIVGDFAGHTPQSTPSDALFMAKLPIFSSIRDEFVAMLHTCYGMAESSRKEWLKSGGFKEFSLENVAGRLKQLSLVQNALNH
ncbi:MULTISPECIES: DEAD/DEAH box helicase family protein [unclassified Sphingopyxis]|uniref:DEAD/DEAH box helicase family protein n=1 Tax=unclassified Sphingopyxis TaxID=2614943 RepID=UPI0028630371|nr:MULTISPECIES: DEAD/DEAH box helicase family protein [unclassified Sphingopyxis]MDR6834975.1 hypothetical protein [Sphingopyxis sp. BE122]MDR7227246.1 hypothetical protein [Sphingopyxis sp. BE259]